MKKKKISLSGVKVKSFVVSFDKEKERTIKGGGSIWCGDETIEPGNCEDQRTTWDDGCW